MTSSDRREREAAIRVVRRGVASRLLVVLAVAVLAQIAAWRSTRPSGGG